MLIIDNLTVSVDEPPGTVIGTFTALNAGQVVPCNFAVMNAGGDFAISDSNLITEWSSMIPGHSSIHVRASGIDTPFKDDARFTVNVV